MKNSEQKDECLTSSGNIANAMLVAVCAEKQISKEKEPCTKSCSQSDWYKGGKCDINGCYYE